MTSSNLDLSGLRKIAEAAHDHIGNLCTGEDRWRMTVPPRDDDSDMLFSTLADGVLALLDRIEELETELAGHQYALLWSDGELDPFNIGVELDLVLEAAHSEQESDPDGELPKVVQRPYALGRWKEISSD